HSETRTTPTALWHKKRPSLRPLPLHPFGIATVSQVRLPAVSYYPRHQPLFSPGPLCRPNPHAQNLPGPAVRLSGGQTHCPPPQTVRSVPRRGRPRSPQTAAGATEKSSRSPALPAVSHPLTSGGGVLLQAGGTAPEPPSPRAQNRGLERHLHPRG